MAPLAGEREAELEARLDAPPAPLASFTDAVGPGGDPDGSRPEAPRFPRRRLVGDGEGRAFGDGPRRGRARTRSSGRGRSRVEGASRLARLRRRPPLPSRSSAGLDAPDYQIASMSSDGPGKRSIEVTHRNLPALFFRAYRFDLEDAPVRAAKDYNLLPAWRELDRFVRSGKARRRRGASTFRRRPTTGPTGPS